jgi:hypothetical protein
LLKRIEDHMDKNDHFYQPGEQFFDYNPRVWEIERTIEAI